MQRLLKAMRYECNTEENTCDANDRLAGFSGRIGAPGLQNRRGDKGVCEMMEIYMEVSKAHEEKGALERSVGRPAEDGVRWRAFGVLA